MYYIKERAMLLLCSILIIDGERWYPASFDSELDLPKLFYFGPPPLMFKTNVLSVNKHKNPTKIELSNHTKWSDWNFMRKTDVKSTTPASLPPTRKTYNKNKNSKLNLITKNHNTKQNTHKYEPIPVINASNYEENVPTTTTRPLTPVFKFNNTIHNINVIRTSKPKKTTVVSKRKVVKRCPSVRPRQKKELDLNATARHRFLQVFEVVEFDHVVCTSSSGLEGTCLPENECQDSGGSPMGSCADGYGTCCVTQFSCDGRSAAPVGWFTNPGFPLPSTERLSCTLILDKSSGNTQQIRLDFKNFELLPPNDGTCEQDQFVITGQNVNNIVPILCGVNTGQHIYIEVGNAEGPITFSVQTISSDSRLFSIKVTQLGSNDDLAPSGCLQYYKGPLGYLESFNYRDKSDIAIARAPSYLNNLNYAMCIERDASSCSVTYTNAGIMQIVNYDTEGLPVIPPGQAGVETFNCPTDWLLLAAIRLCGDRLNDGSVLQDFALDAPITDISTGPMVVWFRSDGVYNGRGFRIQFQQNQC